MASPTAPLLRRHGVRLRSTIFATAIVGAAFIGGAVIMLSMLHLTQDESMYRSTRDRASSIAEQISRVGPENADRALMTPSTAVDVIQVVDPQGRVVYAAPEDRRTSAPLATPAPGTYTRFDDVPIEGSQDEYCGVVTATTHNGQTYRVMVAASTRPYWNGLWTAAILLAVEFPVALGITCAALYIILGRTLRPVTQITTQVEKITSTDLSKRVPAPPTSDEIADLAHSMNTMLDRLQASQDNQKRFVGDASHELRGPLTTLLGILDLAEHTGTHIDPETVGTVLLPEARRMNLLVNDLLLLARADEKALLSERTAVDLDDLVNDAVSHLTAVADPAITITSTITAARVTGDRAKLDRALSNLATNARQHARTAIDISLERTESTVTLTVSDDGPGIPEEFRDHVFERFVRLSEERRPDGTGLGLAIVREIVHAHRGTVVVSESRWHGAQFVVTLPASS